MRWAAKWVGRGLAVLTLVHKLGTAGAVAVVSGVVTGLSGIPTLWSVIVFLGLAVVLFVAVGSTLGHWLTRKQRALAIELRGWCDELTARLLFHGIPHPPAIPTDEQTRAFQEDYFRLGDGLRNRGLAIIDKGIAHGAMDEQLRRRLHTAKNPTKFWPLMTVLYEQHIRPWQPPAARAMDKRTS